MFNKSLKEVVKAIQHEISYLNDKVNTQRLRVDSFGRDVDRIDRTTHHRLKILEDSVSRVARTLDANHITEACSHCGQVKPEDWKSKV